MSSAPDHVAWSVHHRVPSGADAVHLGCAHIGRDPGEVRVRLTLDDAELVLGVEDDGKGLRPRYDSPGMDRRAAAADVSAGA
jgi:hypothetical protein